MSIREKWGKIKTLLFQERLMVALIIILVSTASFGLGRLSMAQDMRQPVRIVSPAIAGQQTAAQAAPQDPGAITAGSFVASVNGTKYYPVGCSSAGRISDGNKVWFDSEQQAEAQGYTKATNCTF